jgi:hypothetical protein
MNLFKVIASGKKSFFEEHMSAILAWFMNPRMEHGLGFLFLNRFIIELQKEQQALNEISNKLVNQLRSDSDNELKWSCKLEYNVVGAFIDIAFFLDEWIIAIENKIYTNSANDEKQLVREYQGLKTKNPGNNIGMIFLVPYTSQDGDLLNDKIQKEYDAFDVEPGRAFKQIVSWQKNTMRYPSISAIIEGILEDESKGHIEPVPEYTRHTLKAFNVFINNDFEGYYYDGSTRYSGNNENTEENLTVTQLSGKTSGYVGVQNGISGLILMDSAKISKRTFQYSTVDMSKRNNWMGIDTFNKVVTWLLTGNEPNIIWDAVLPARILYKITSECPNASAYIGIKGGLKALEAMSKEEIAGKRWGMKTADVPPTNQWIEGSKFRAVIESKGVF